MSCLGNYKECKNICICLKCKRRGISCGPCMDCNGTADEEGFVIECKSFKSKEKK